IKKKRNKYIDSDPCFAILYSNPKAKLATVDELIASMDEAGVDISVIVNIGWTTHELCVETNDYILESVARYPDRLIGFCAVQPQSYEAAVDEIERCARGGIRGVGELRPDMQLLDLRDKEMMEPLVEVMKKYKLILLTHTSEPVGHDYPGKGSITPDMLYPFITSFPDLPIVCAHWGGGLPFYALMSEVKQAMNNVFFDTAASPLLYSPEIYHQVTRLVGADKILFGSDYPLLAQNRIINEIKSSDLPEEAKGQILGGNAQKLLGIKG
ncbi:MAG TPA: amidohydrolase family protein, partial [Dehalococcoidales bacterium]|nr:amidohydrolase family protein [Dehalococcoidales bacterium]